jgi:hypothetical protein
MKAVFQNAIAAQDSAAFLAAAKRHSITPEKVMPYADKAEVRKTGTQVLVSVLARFDRQDCGDGLRDGATGFRKTEDAKTYAFSLADLAKVTVAEIANHHLVYRLSEDVYVFESRDGIRSDAATWGEIRKAVEQAAYQQRWGSAFAECLLGLEIEALPA